MQLDTGVQLRSVSDALGQLIITPDNSTEKDEIAIMLMIIKHIASNRDLETKCHDNNWFKTMAKKHSSSLLSMESNSESTSTNTTNNMTLLRDAYRLKQVLSGNKHFPEIGLSSNTLAPVLPELCEYILNLESLKWVAEITCPEREYSSILTNIRECILSPFQTATSGTNRSHWNILLSRIMNKMVDLYTEQSAAADPHLLEALSLRFSFLDNERTKKLLIYHLFYEHFQHAVKTDIIESSKRTYDTAIPPLTASHKLLLNMMIDRSSYSSIYILPVLKSIVEECITSYSTHANYVTQLKKYKEMLGQITHIRQEDIPYLRDLTNLLSQSPTSCAQIIDTVKALYSDSGTVIRGFLSRANQIYKRADLTDDERHKLVEQEASATAKQQCDNDPSLSERFFKTLLHTPKNIASLIGYGSQTVTDKQSAKESKPAAMKKWLMHYWRTSTPGDKIAGDPTAVSQVDTHVKPLKTQLIAAVDIEDELDKKFSTAVKGIKKLAEQCGAKIISNLEEAKTYKTRKRFFGSVLAQLHTQLARHYTYMKKDHERFEKRLNSLQNRYRKISHRMLPVDLEDKESALETVTLSEVKDLKDRDNRPLKVYVLDIEGGAAPVEVSRIDFMVFYYGLIGDTPALNKYLTEQLNNGRGSLGRAFLGTGYLNTSGLEQYKYGKKHFRKQYREDLGKQYYEHLATRMTKTQLGFIKTQKDINRIVHKVDLETKNVMSKIGSYETRLRTEFTLMNKWKNKAFNTFDRLRGKSRKRSNSKRWSTRTRGKSVLTRKRDELFSSKMCTWLSYFLMYLRQYKAYCKDDEVNVQFERLFTKPERDALETQGEWMIQYFRNFLKLDKEFFVEDLHVSRSSSNIPLTRHV